MDALHGWKLKLDEQLSECASGLETCLESVDDETKITNQLRAVAQGFSVALSTIQGQEERLEEASEALDQAEQAQHTQSPA